MASTYDDRPLRVCDLCGAVDRDPRHSIAGTVPGQVAFPPPASDVADRVVAAVNEAPVEERSRLLRDFYDQSTSDRHRDCCAAAGCPAAGDPKDGCDVLVAGAKGTGKAMLQNIIAKRQQAANIQDEER